MAVPHQHQSTIRNGLLAALPPEDLARLRPSLHPVELPFDETLFPADGTTEAVLFPEGEDQDNFSVGVGLAWPRFQIDAAYQTSDTYKVGSISVVTRF